MRDTVKRTEAVGKRAEADMGGVWGARARGAVAALLQRDVGVQVLPWIFDLGDRHVVRDISWNKGCWSLSRGELHELGTLPPQQPVLSPALVRGWKESSKQ